ncbi:TPA: hypothetical protein NV714_005058 [Escherichia coli]|nr:hypothetical protein [Escherichia coli]
MTLRDKIKQAIEQSNDSEIASIKVCQILEDEIGLSGNGWFDDDETMLNILDEE